MFDLFKVIPQAFRAGQAILNCIKGGPTREELQTAVEELRELLATIPSMKGVLAIFDSVIAVVERILPHLLDDPEAFGELELSADTVQEASQVVTLYKAVMTEVKNDPQFAGVIKLDDVDRMV
jgi:chromosome condensin MukBEF ATPase and DNA-binding subunit MukB